MRKTARRLATLCVATGLLAACGGGQTSIAETAGDTAEASATTAPTVPPTAVPPTEVPATAVPEATVPEATVPPATVAPIPDPATPELPEWASGELVTVGADTGPLELPVELAAFCESSRSFYVAAHALDFVDVDKVDIDDAAAFEQLFGAQSALLPTTIETAPSEEYAAFPIAMSEQLAVIIPAFAQVGYDQSRLGELDDPEVLEAFTAFVEIQASLDTFLVEECGADRSVLDEQAAGAAELVGGSAPTSAPVEAVEGTPIQNQAMTISVSVPTDWIDIQESDESGFDQLIVSSDIEGFFTLSTPGAVVLRGEGGFRDGGYYGRVLEFQALLEDVSCEVVNEGDYDDGVYVGREQLYDCGSASLEVRVFGGATADESLYAVVMLVQPIDQQGIRQLIVNTFEVA